MGKKDMNKYGYIYSDDKAITDKASELKNMGIPEKVQRRRDR